MMLSVGIVTFVKILRPGLFPRKNFLLARDFCVQNGRWKRDGLLY